MTQDAKPGEPPSLRTLGWLIAAVAVVAVACCGQVAQVAAGRGSHICCIIGAGGAILLALGLWARMAAARKGPPVLRHPRDTWSAEEGAQYERDLLVNHRLRDQTSTDRAWGTTVAFVGGALIAYAVGIAIWASQRAPG